MCIRDTASYMQEPTWPLSRLGEPRYSQSLERGLAILGCFTPKRPLLGIADIADELGMRRSTTHRYVITLVALGYLCLLYTSKENYLYRVLPGLEKEGKLEKKGRGWYPKAT